jgi:hypothetical protein
LAKIDSINISLKMPAGMEIPADSDLASRVFKRGRLISVDLDGDGIPDVALWEAFHISATWGKEDLFYRRVFVNAGGAWYVLDTDELLECLSRACCHDAGRLHPELAVHDSDSISLRPRRDTRECLRLQSKQANARASRLRRGWTFAGHVATALVTSPGVTKSRHDSAFAIRVTARAVGSATLQQCLDRRRTRPW